MVMYTIGQVAERTGISSSALRFYERHELLAPVARSDAGYRLYDDSSLERLNFIGRAKQLGCTLEEVADLAALWEADDCGPVQARLHELVTAKITDSQRRSAELTRFTAQLQTAAFGCRWTRRCRSTSWLGSLRLSKGAAHSSRSPSPSTVEASPSR